MLYADNNTLKHGMELTHTHPSMPVLGVVVPCYNEEAVLEKTSVALSHKIGELVDKGLIDAVSFVLFVDDGSSDGTWKIIEQLHGNNKSLFHGVRFSHNQGHQNAVYAGMIEACTTYGCDAAVSMDADLQDDPDALDAMVQSYLDGNEIVFALRDNRDTDTVFKRFTAEMFYGLMRRMGTDIIPDHADYRLMGRTAVKALSRYQEVNLFLRGIVPSLGFRTDRVYYKRAARAAGESKYPFSKMVSFALEGITSFSVKPLRVITVVGVISVFVGLGMLGYAITSVSMGRAVSGWGSLMCSLWIVGGLILVSQGIVGEYIGRIYLEVKHRPRYIIETEI